MKRLFISALSLLALTATANAQSNSLEEGFEAADLLTSGWTTRTSSDASGNKFKWEKVAYTSNPLNLRSGYTQGGDSAMMVSSGKTTSAGIAPDSWLISPAVTVADGDYLSFMLAYAPVYNDVATVPAEQRIKFAVLVSTTGTEADDFTETLFEFAPYGDTDWRKKVFSLSKFAGQTIHIAFRDYGNASTGPVTLNRTWIDDVVVGQGASSDFVATELLSPAAGPNLSQKVSFKYTNSGLAPQTLSVSYKVNDNDPVTEKVDLSAAPSDTTLYTFQTPATLNVGSNKVSVWATADNDGVHENDTLTSTVTIEKVFSLPYEMNSDNLSDGWTYTYHTGKLNRGTNTGWWQVPDETMTKYVWSYKLCAKESILEGKWFALEEGKANITFNYTSGTEVPLEIQYTKNPAEGEEAETHSVTATLPASTEAASQTVSIDVPETGVYKLGLKCGDTYAGPFAINTLNLTKVAKGDVAVTEVKTDKAVVANTPQRIYVKVRNYSEEDLADIPVKVDVDGQTVSTDIVSNVPAGGVVDVEIGQTNIADETLRGISYAEGTHDVKVYTAFENDINAANDTLSTTVYAYTKPEMPFAESFENETDNQRWTSENLSDNALDWTIDTAVVGNLNWAKDGENAAYMSSVAGAEHNAVLRSPVIRVNEAGKVRLSYYYTTRMTATNADDRTFLTVSVKGVSAETADFEVSRKDSISDANVGSYHQGYLLANLPAAGDYRIEFLNTGLGHDIVLDDIRFDQLSDWAIVAATQTAKTGFNNTVSQITARIANHGAADKAGFSLILKTLHADGTETSLTEQYEGTILAGDTVAYTFADVDVSQADTYTFGIQLIDNEDADEFNNAWTLPSITTFANATLPYTADFDTEEQQLQWTLNGGWQTGTYTSSSSAYNGTGAISHHRAAESEDGDWAFSGCIEIPAGTYDLTFFYRTFLNGKTEKLYAQNFAVYLGTEPKAEAMTQVVYTSPVDAIASDKRYKKVAEQLTVAEDGQYYIGIKCTSSSAYGVLYVDDIQLKEADATAPVLNDYTADFSTWYHYDPSTQFAQWTEAEDGNSLVATQKIFNAGNPQVELPGLLVSPAFTLTEGTTVLAALDYSMAIEDASNVSDDEKAKMRTTVCLLHEHNPEAVCATIAEGDVADGSRQTASSSFDITETGVYYFAIGTSGAENCLADDATLTYNLYGLTLSSVETGITTAKSQLTGNVELFDLNGRLIGSFDNASDALKNCPQRGVYILHSQDSANSVKVIK